MKYKLVCVDMDGTLLDSSKNIKKRNNKRNDNVIFCFQLFQKNKWK